MFPAFRYWPKIHISLPTIQPVYHRKTITIATTLTWKSYCCHIVLCYVLFHYYYYYNNYSYDRYYYYYCVYYYRHVITIETVVIVVIDFVFNQAALLGPK